MEEYVFRAIAIGIVNLAIFVIAGLFEQRSDCFTRRESVLREELRSFEAIRISRRLSKHEEKKAKRAKAELKVVHCQGSKAARQSVIAFICSVVTEAIFLVLMLVFLQGMPNNIAIALLASGVALGANRIMAKKWDFNTTFCMALIAIFAIFFYKLER